MQADVYGIRLSLHLVGLLCTDQGNKTIRILLGKRSFVELGRARTRCVYEVVFKVTLSLSLAFLSLEVHYPLLKRFPYSVFL